MGQKSNVLTIRKVGLNFNSNEKSNKQFILLYLTLQHLQKLFFKVDVCMLNWTLQKSSNKIYLNFDLFFRTRKLIKYKKFYKKLQHKNKNIFRSYYILSIIKFLKSKFSIFLINFKFCVFNNLLLKKNKLRTKLLFEFYDLFRRYSKFLFPRRVNFFLDFIKLSVLFFFGFLKISFFIKLFSEIFTILQKKRHSFFFQFIKFFFITLLNYNVTQSFLISEERVLSKILGVKFLAAGKLKGKPRASTLNMCLGNIPVQSLNMNIEYAKQHIYTRYGVFGFKIWLNRGYRKI
jgi:hypothetical protein